jgi:hypothetical protein
MPDAKTTKPSLPDEVDAYIAALKHPLVKVVRLTRETVLSASPSIGEEIKWNAPSFFFKGKMAPSDPKLYLRYLVNFNLFRKDCLRLIFLRAGEIPDPAGLLQGDYKDGRRLVLFSSMDEVKANAAALKRILRAQLEQIEQ